MAANTVRAPKPFITLQQASFRLGDRLVFEKTDWSLAGDEQWAVIGPNGSGKSVLADGLRGRLPLVHGELRYHFRPPGTLTHEEAIGHVAFEDRKSELHGTVVQSRWSSFEEEGSLSVGEFLSYERVMEVNPFEIDPGQAVARRGFERRLRRAVALFQIAGFLPRRLLSLSNGERQRVQLARALARPLRLLILDEPYVGLDRVARQHFHRLLEQLLKVNLRVLLLTTRIEDLPRHISHLLWVENCSVLECGTKTHMLKRAGRLTGLNGVRRLKRLSTILSRGRTPAGPIPVVGPAGSARAGPRSPKRAKLIELCEVTVRYGNTVILDRVNWTVYPGESWALLGPNGSGKTTLLSLIQGDHPQAYANRIMVFGHQRGTGESVWELKQRIGWVSPELQLHFDDTISVFEVVASGFQDTIGIFEAPTGRQAEATRRWLAQLQLLESAEQPLFSLSAGLQRMALLARALVKEPRLLILDEPCQGLDPEHRQLIIGEVDRLIRIGTVTVIFVTHRPEEIPKSIKNVLRLPGRNRPFSGLRGAGSAEPGLPS